MENTKTELEQELNELRDAEKQAQWSVDWHIKGIASDNAKITAYKERIAHLEAVLTNDNK